LKKPVTKKAWWSGSRCRPWVQTQVLGKENQKTKNDISHLVPGKI
jgi:hypothetical protein